MDGLTEADGLSEADGLREALEDPDGLREALADPDGLTLAEGLTPVDLTATAQVMYSLELSSALPVHTPIALDPAAPAFFNLATSRNTENVFDPSSKTSELTMEYPLGAPAVLALPPE